MKKQRLIAGLLTVMMLLTLIPATAVIGFAKSDVSGEGNAPVLLADESGTEVEDHRDYDQAPRINANYAIDTIKLDGWQEGAYNYGIAMTTSSSERDEPAAGWWAVVNGYSDGTNWIDASVDRIDFGIKGFLATLDPELNRLYFYAAVKDAEYSQETGSQPYEMEGVELYIDPYGDTDPVGDFEDKLILLRIGRDGSLSGHYQANEISVAGTASDVHTLTRPEDAETWDPDLAGHYITNEYKQGDKTYAQVLVRNFDGKDFLYEGDTGFAMENGTDTYVYYEGCIDLSAFDLQAGQQLSWMLRALDYSTEEGCVTSSFSHDGYRGPLETNYYKSSTIGDQIWYYNVLDEEAKTAELVQYAGESTEVVMPSELDGYTIVSFATSLFSNNNMITKVTLADTITSLPQEAFAYCNKLEEINFPEDIPLDVIPQKAFYMAQIPSFTLPSSVREIQPRAFRSCEEMATFTIPEDSQLEVVGVEAFFECSSLKELIFPEGFREFGAAENKNQSPIGVCVNLSVISLPSTLEELPTYTIVDCYSDLTLGLEHLYVNNPNMVMEDECISGCYNAYIHAAVGSTAQTYCEEITYLYGLFEGANDPYLKSGARFNCDMTGEDTHHALIPFEKLTTGPMHGYECAICHYRVQHHQGNDPICGASTASPHAEHSYTVNKVSKAPTCTEPGESLVTCEYCGYAQNVEQTTEVPALGHDYQVTKEAKEPTCVEDGWTEEISCVRCGDVQKASETIPATGEHDYSVEVVTLEPTCTEPGRATHNCSVCGENDGIEVEIPALGHDLVPDEDAEVVQPTCTEPGSASSAHCSRCDYTETDVVLPALGHNYEEKRIEPGYSHEGAIQQACTRCGDVESSEPIPVLNIEDRLADVAKGQWFTPFIAYCLDEGLMSGQDEYDGNGREYFRPDSTMTRAELVTVLYNMEGQPAVEVEPIFNDVAADQWFAEEVTWASQNKIVYGTSPTEFSPNEPISRQDLATILHRYAVDYKGLELTVEDPEEQLSAYVDVNQIATHGWMPLAALNKAGVITGDGDRLKPQDSASRGEVASMFNRFISNVLEATEA